MFSQGLKRLFLNIGIDDIMGRVKTAQIKRVTKALMEKYGDNFTKNFEENKAVVRNYADIPSKKLRNIIAGYITKLTKVREE